MIEVTLKQALDSVGILRSLSARQLKGRVAYNIAKIIKQVENEFNLFSETRQKVIETYGKKDEQGNLEINPETNEYVFEGDNLQKVMDELNGLLDSTVSINANKIDLNDLETISFTPTEMNELECFIEE